MKTSPSERLHHSLFLRACRREPTERTPIWIMRQAGRYMKEYQEVRSKIGFLELCKHPDLAAEVSVVAVEKLGVDAAIIFSDILLILEPMGVGLEYEKDGGPVIRRPVRTGKDIDRLQEVHPDESLDFVYAAIRKARASLSLDIPLIGFGGAPFTLASYLIEGKGSKSFTFTKKLMHDDPGAWHALLNKIVPPLTSYLNRQISEGAQALQLFDSWVGCLKPAEYRKFVLPHSKKLIAGLNPDVPVIHFGTDTAPLLELMKEAGGTVIGLDWKIDLDEGWRRLGPKVGVQGNLDPTVLLTSPQEIRDRAKNILDQAAGRPGHIFNLGHGVLPTTPIDNVIALVDMVHEMSARPSS